MWEDEGEGDLMIKPYAMKKRFRIGLAIGLFITGVSAFAGADYKEVRLEVDQQAEELIESLTGADPVFTANLETAAGYFAGQLVHVQAGIVGAGSGTGVLVDRTSGERFYLDVTRFDMGPGFGGQVMSAVILIQDRDILEDAKSGNWVVSWGAEAAAGEASAAARRKGSGYTVYAFTNDGLLAMASLRTIRFRLNPEMNNLGVSAFNLPNRSASYRPDEEPATWNRALPFLAQKVVDKGFTLPLPYGIGAIYAHAEQEQDLTSMKIGFGGSEKVPVEGIVLEDVISTNNAWQFKADTWVLPFLNVFGTVGYIDGKGPLSVRLDGDTLLEDLGISCGGIISHPLCKVLGGKSVTFPVTASFQGLSYHRRHAPGRRLERLVHDGSGHVHLHRLERFLHGRLYHGLFPEGRAGDFAWKAWKPGDFLRCPVPRQ
jgi:lipid-binding SYLF domain-containing protein